ncbi:MAG: glf [Candidatus Levybacteria bacterium]|nr:glf [Candidatus Levybacteria bacterium]
MTHDIVVIGSGISGATIAERYARVLNKKVLVIEKRDHVGGNCYDFYDDAGILVSKYGAHLFHTNDKNVWKYLQMFSAWKPYAHTVLSSVDGILVPVPVNITTVNLLFNLHVQTEEEMRQWLKTQIVKIDHPANSEELALSRVGKTLYEKLFKNYTIKQWNTNPKNLDESVIGRIPVRTNFDTRYFSDKYQAMPKLGYTELFKKMLSHPNITIQLNTDYFKIKDSLKGFEKLFFTGPIDLYFQKKSTKKLGYRSLRFEFETFDFPYYQTNSVINYPNDREYTRILEFKHMYQQKHPKTTIAKEYPTWDGEPYYPVLSKENLALYEFYKRQADLETKKGVYFVGRLANYKYFNMDRAFSNALNLFYSLNPHLDKIKNLDYNKTSGKA